MGKYTDIYREYRGNEPIPKIEREKYPIAVEMDQAEGRGDYEELIRLGKKLAEICHGQGKERDAYWLEHDAFLNLQKLIYKKAGLSTSAFKNMPYVELLKKAMSTAAEQAKAYKQVEYVVCYKKMIARLCRAQGKEGDAYRLECDIRAMQGTAQEIQMKKKMTDMELEAQCLQWIAQNYGDELSDE